MIDLFNSLGECLNPNNKPLKKMPINEYQDFALGNFLSDWNPEHDYHDILEALTHDDCVEDCHLCQVRDDVVVWEPFEHHSGCYVANQICNMVNSTMRIFKPIKNTP